MAREIATTGSVFHEYNALDSAGQQCRDEAKHRADRFNFIDPLMQGRQIRYRAKAHETIFEQPASRLAESIEALTQIQAVIKGMKAQITAKHC